MKGLKSLLATLLAGSVMLAAMPAASASAAAYSHYVACGLSQHAKRSHHCKRKRKKGAFFRSNRATVFYTVCVRFPTKKSLCANREEATRGTLYVNQITSNIPGKHRVTWFVKGKRVGAFFFRVRR